MIAIIDYNTGNIRSVTNALDRIGVQDYRLTADADTIRSASHVLLPGVGEASTAMQELRSRQLDSLIPTLTQPVLGICIGTQLMCMSSEEGDAQCMGIFPTRVVKFRREAAAANSVAANANSIAANAISVAANDDTVPLSPFLKVPHMGWNTITHLNGPLFEGIPEGAWVYYVHSFYPELCNATAARTDYGVAFSGSLWKDNFFGTQFHPEKSGTVGEKILRNFLRL